MFIANTKWLIRDKGTQDSELYNIPIELFYKFHNIKIKFICYIML
jgi:hypothetical protein